MGINKTFGARSLGPDHKSTGSRALTERSTGLARTDRLLLVLTYHLQTWLQVTLSLKKSPKWVILITTRSLIQTYIAHLSITISQGRHVYRNTDKPSLVPLDDD